MCLFCEHDAQAIREQRSSMILYNAIIIYYITCITRGFRGYFEGVSAIMLYNCFSLIGLSKKKNIYIYLWHKLSTDKCTTYSKETTELNYLC